MMIVIALLLTCVVGCTDPYEKAARQEAEAVAQRNMSIEAGLPNLRKGMTVDEVSATLGITFGLTPISGKVIFPNGHSVSFLDGRLTDWK